MVKAGGQRSPWGAMDGQVVPLHGSGSTAGTPVTSITPCVLRPASTSSSVVLPAPLAPIRHVSWPGRITPLRPCSAECACRCAYRSGCRAMQSRHARRSRCLECWPHPWPTRVPPICPCPCCTARPPQVCTARHATAANLPTAAHVQQLDHARVLVALGCLAPRRLVNVVVDVPVGEGGANGVQQSMTGQWRGMQAAAVVPHPS